MEEEREVPRDAFHEDAEAVAKETDGRVEDDDGEEECGAGICDARLPEKAKHTHRET